MSARRRGPLKPIYVAATAEHAGKSAISLGLCLALRERGYNVGYFKPVGVLARHVDHIIADADALQAQEVLGLPDAITDLCPVVLSAQMVDDVVGGKKIDPLKPIRKAYARVSEGRDIVIVEGLGQLIRGSFMGASGYKLVSMLDAGTLLLAKYDDTVMLDRILAGQKWLDGSLLGVIFNFVPRGRLDQVTGQYREFLNRKHIKVYGVIKGNPKLSAVTVQSIGRHLKAEVLSAEDHVNRLVESVLIGAMNQEHALRYFQRVAGKVVVTGGDRSDIILAALETPTVAVVLTGNFRPSPSVLARAEEKEIPLLLTGADTLSAINELQELFGRFRVREPSKIKLITSLIEEHVDLDGLVRNLGKK